MIKGNRFVGIDPSLRATGIATYIKSDKTFCLTRCTQELCKDKSFQATFKDAQNMVSEIVKKVYSSDCVITEVPPPTGQYASGLSILDSLLCEKALFYCPDSVFTANPNLIAHIHGTRKYTKTDSVMLARNMVEVFKEEGYNLIFRANRFDNNEADAFILLVYLLVSKGIIKSKVEELGIFCTDKLIKL